jgi:hypothetical protein
MDRCVEDSHHCETLLSSSRCRLSPPAPPFPWNLVHLCTSLFPQLFLVVVTPHLDTRRPLVLVAIVAVDGCGGGWWTSVCPKSLASSRVEARHPICFLLLIYLSQSQIPNYLSCPPSLYFVSCPFSSNILSFLSSSSTPPLILAIPAFQVHIPFLRQPLSLIFIILFSYRNSAIIIHSIGFVATHSSSLRGYLVQIFCHKSLNSIGIFVVGVTRCILLYPTTL